MKFEKLLNDIFKYSDVSTLKEDTKVINFDSLDIKDKKEVVKTANSLMKSICDIFGIDNLYTFSINEEDIKKDTELDDIKKSIKEKVSEELNKIDITKNPYSKDTDSYTCTKDTCNCKHDYCEFNSNKPDKTYTYNINDFKNKDNVSFSVNVQDLKNFESENNKCVCKLKEDNKCNTDLKNKLVNDYYKIHKFDYQKELFELVTEILSAGGPGKDFEFMPDNTKKTVRIVIDSSEYDHIDSFLEYPNNVSILSELKISLLNTYKFSDVYINMTNTSIYFYIVL